MKVAAPAAKESRAADSSVSQLDGDLFAHLNQRMVADETGTAVDDLGRTNLVNAPGFVDMPANDERRLLLVDERPQCR